MNAKILKMLSISLLFTLIIFSGCGEKIVYVDRPVKVNIPVYCEAPEVECNIDLNVTYTEKIEGFNKCIDLYKASNDVCRKKDK